jgi:hydroxymethylpyrimidine pyrophosphatase-like HAD family hydrolase
MKTRKEIKKFINRIIDIIKKENISIKYYRSNHNYNYEFIIDGITYNFYRDDDFVFASSYLNITESNDEKVPIVYYWKIKFLHLKQVREGQKKYKEKCINNLPDLSDVGRTSKKYNI